MNNDTNFIFEAYKKVNEASLSYDREGNAYDSLQDAHNASVANKLKKEEQYDKSSNSPYSRGEADSYYRRTQRPHYYVKNADGSNLRVEEKDMTPEEIEAYYAGYRDNENDGAFKDYEGDAR
jgi:hypothetical protein